MRFPNRNSCGLAICQALYTAEQLDLQGLYAALKGRFTERGVAGAVEIAHENGSVVKKDDRYALSLMARRHMDERMPHPPDADAAPLVQPRTPPPFRPLSASHKPSARGTREGSNDHLRWKSRY